MKVLIVRGFPEKINLNSYNVQEIGLAKALRKKDVICDIVFFGGKDPDHEDMLRDGTVIYWLHGFNFLKNGMMPGVKELADSYDVIQVQEYDQLQSWRLYTFLHKPVVIYHGPYFDPFNRGYNMKCAVFDHTFLLMSGKAKRNVICLTKSPMAEEFLKKKGFRHIRCVGVGLDAEAMRNSISSASVSWQEQTGSAEDVTGPTDVSKTKDARLSDKDDPALKKGPRFELLYVGKLEERRNIPFLLRVIHKLADSDIHRADIHMTLVGTGDPSFVQTLMPQMKELEGEGVLTYIPGLSQKELAPLYQRADLFLFPSYYDIFGMVLLEAMYYGCVCVSSRNGGAASLIRDDTGLIIDHFDENEWVQGVLSLLSDRKKLESMKQNAAREIREHFLWDDLADQFIETYQEVSGRS